MRIEPPTPDDFFGAGGTGASFGAAAILLATINIAGGFLVTQRMLKMFRR